MGEGGGGGGEGVQANPLNSMWIRHRFEQINRVHIPDVTFEIQEHWPFREPFSFWIPLNMYFCGGAQWFSGRVLDSRPWALGFEPHRRHWVVSLSKTHLF